MRLLSYISLIIALILPQTAMAFYDVDEYYIYKDAIYYIQDEGIVEGYDDGSYQPYNELNRAELLKIAIEAAFYDEFENSADDCFDDIDPGEWYAKYVCFAKEQEIIVGYDDGTFKPGQKVTFVEAMKIIMYSFGHQFDEGEPWYTDMVSYGDGQEIIPIEVDILENLTRGEMAELATRVLLHQEGTLDDYLADEDEDEDLEEDDKEKEENIESDKEATEDQTDEDSNEEDVAEEDDQGDDSEEEPDDEEEAPEEVESQIQSWDWSTDDLNEIWGLEIGRESEKAAISSCDSIPDLADWYDESDDYEFLQSTTIGDIEVMIYAVTEMADDIYDNNEGAIYIMELWLEKAQEYFGEFPCDQIIVMGDYAAYGSPGRLTINMTSDGGFAYYWLQWHELTHSYFGTHSAESLWMREGVATMLPTIISEDLYDELDFEDDIFETTIEPQGTIEGNYMNYMNEGWSKYDLGQDYTSRDACDLIEPDGADDNYVINSDWGRVFLTELAYLYGNEVVVNALRAVYEKYRYTDLTEITDTDFYQAFLYYMSVQNSLNYDLAEELLDAKLCF